MSSSHHTNAILNQMKEIKSDVKIIIALIFFKNYVCKVSLRNEFSCPVVLSRSLCGRNLFCFEIPAEVNSHRSFSPLFTLINRFKNNL